MHDFLRELRSGIVIPVSTFSAQLRKLSAIHKEAVTYQQLLSGTPGKIRSRGYQCTSRFVVYKGNRACYSTKCNPSTTGKRWHQWIEPVDEAHKWKEVAKTNVRVYCDCLHFLYSGVLWLLQTRNLSDNTFSVPAPTVKTPYLGLCKHLVACGPYLNVLDYLQEKEEEEKLAPAPAVKKPSTPTVPATPKVPKAPSVPTRPTAPPPAGAPKTPSAPTSPTSPKAPGQGIRPTGPTGPISPSGPSKNPPGAPPSR